MLLLRPVHAALRIPLRHPGRPLRRRDRGRRSAMWVVKDADSTVYLLGTIHVLKPGVNWRSEKLDAALKSSDEYWMEADIEADPAIAQTYALNFGMDSRNSLASTVGEANFAKLLDLAKRYDIPTDRLHQMRPWLATMVLTRAQVVSVGYDPELGVDRTLEKEAMKAGKPIKPFETASEQLGHLADMPDKIAARNADPDFGRGR